MVKPVKHDIKEIQTRGPSFRWRCTCGANARSWVGTSDEAVALHALHVKHPDNGTFAIIEEEEKNDPPVGLDAIARPRKTTK